MKNNKKGFSLIELSIVLIIIGLLVAGITGGASLIKSAELRSFMSELRNYQTAVNAYYTATGELPGSEGSSQINFTKSCLAWANMMKEGVVDVDVSAVNSDMDECTQGTENGVGAESAVSKFTSENSPTSKLKGGLYAIGYNNDMADNVIFVVAADETPGKLTAAESPSNAKTDTSSMTIKDARSVDEKMDNGIIDSGKMFGFTGPTVGEVTACDYDDTDNDSTTICNVAISIGL